LSLFGFDAIVPADGEDSSVILVIDVNYFPSYKEVPDFPSRLKKYLWRLAFQR
jgi:inositol-1,3,4-trisphosphate 5/6-kinase / inositol-tetrakisphosphate 1-kinase